jgi:hypothetical protein
MYSISRSDTASYTSVAAGAASAAAGGVEACALLADGAPSVLLVCYDAPLPDEYAQFQQEPAAPYAFAWRVSAARAGEPHIGLTWTAGEPGLPPRPTDLPFGLEVLRFALSDEPEAELHAGGKRWTWSRHA